MTRHSRLGFPALVLVLSVLSAYFCAAVFVAALQLSLPRTDSAYGQPLSATFADPFVLTVAGMWASLAGLVAFPIALFCLNRRDPIRCGVFVVGLTVLFIAGATVLDPRLGLFGSPLVAVAGLLFCRFSGVQFFLPHEASHDVA